MKLNLILIILLLSPSLFAQEVARFSVQTGEERIDAPVSIALDELNYNTDKGSLILYEMTTGGEKPVPGQVETGHSARLWFILEGISPKNSTRNYILKAEDNPCDQKSRIKVLKGHQDLSLMANENPVLNYRFETTFPPEGVDPLYKRSGYIHPLWSPGGEILTCIQPADHYHHYGIWGPWTLTHIDEREVDFWNLVKGQGTVKFAGFLSQTEGDVFSGFKVLQQHIDFGAAGEDQIAMNEILDIRVWNVTEKVRIIDYTTTLNTPLPNGIMLDAYRYGGGIGFRATENWHKDNSTVMTSEGKDRAEADGSNARWCIVEGKSETGKGPSGILFLSHPSNRMHPEPLRVWPSDANNGRGDLFIEFCPIRHKEWKLKPGNNYSLKYRMIVFDGEMKAETAEKYWNSFAIMPLIHRKK